MNINEFLEKFGSMVNEDTYEGYSRKVIDKILRGRQHLSITDIDFDHTHRF